MADVPTYTKPLFQLEGTPAPVFIDTRDITAFGDALYQKAKSERDQKAFAEAYAKQRLAGSKELLHDDQALIDFDSTDARNKGYQAAFTTGKQIELQNKLIEVEANHPNDPKAAEEALIAYQSEYFSGFDKAPEVLPQFEEMYDQSAAKTLGAIKLNQIKVENDKQTQIILDGLENQTVAVENIAAQGGDTRDLIADIKAKTYAAVDAGRMTPEGASKNLQTISVRASRSLAVGELRRGVKTEDQLLAELNDPKGSYSGLSVADRDRISGEVQQAGNQLRTAHAADREAYDKTATAIVAQVARGNHYDRDEFIADLDRLGYSTTERQNRIDAFDQAAIVGNDYNAFTGGGLYGQKQMVDEAGNLANTSTGDALKDEQNDARYERLAKWYDDSKEAAKKDPHGWYAQQTGLTVDPAELQDEQSVAEYQTRVAMYTQNPDVSPMPPQMIQAMQTDYSMQEGADSKLIWIQNAQKKYGKFAKKILSDMGLDGTTLLASDVLALGPQYQNEAGLLFQAGLNAAPNEEAFKKRKDDRDALTEAATEAFPDIKFGMNAEVADQHRSAMEQVAMELMRTDPDLSAENAAAQAKQIVMRGKTETDVGGETMLLGADDHPDELNSTIRRIASDPIGTGIVIPQGMTLDQYRSYLSDETKTFLVPTTDGTGYNVVDKTYQNKVMVQVGDQFRPLVIRKDGSISQVKSQPSTGKSMWDMNLTTDLTPKVSEYQQPNPRGGERNRTYTLHSTEEAASVAERTFLEVQKSGLDETETFARVVTNQPVLQDQLVGVSAMIAHGDLSETALDVLSQHSEFSRLSDRYVRDKVVEAWKDEANRTGMDAKGQRKTPLHALYDLIRQTPNRPMPRRFGTPEQTSQLEGQSGTDTAQGNAASDLLAVLGQRESSNNYAAENSGGYVGRYQFGAAALADLGVIKREALDGRSQKAILDDSKSWTLKGGKAAFLKDGKYQDQLAQQWTGLLERRLRRAGVIDSSTPADVKNGYIAVAHLLGVGGAKRYARGINGKDANGTTADEYFQLGSDIG